MRRFLAAVWRALLLTLRGETLTPPHYRPLEAWIAAGLEHALASPRRRPA